MFARLKTAALLRAAVVVTAGIVRALVALRRSVFRGGKIAATLRRASATAASTAPAPASSAAAIATLIAAAVTAEALSTAIVAAFGARVFLRWVELPKILRRGGVGFRLALLEFSVRVAISIGFAFGVGFVRLGGLVFVLVLEVRTHRFFVANRLLRGVVGAQGSRFIGTMRVSQRLARQRFDQRGGRRNRRRALGRMS